MKKPELLSPAGNMECLRAAVLAGCDAVYLGGYAFGARSYAGNFSNEEIVEAITYCHLRKVKVYVTVNTLVHEDKFDLCISYIDFLHRNNVDAIIVQDLGLMDYVRRVYPNLEIHASTQMHIHNVEGVLFAQDLGIKRAVIARETSIAELSEMKRKSSVALEVFIHGALCVGYSGQCLMSSMIGGRSGNLGTCSQCCRMKYTFLSNGVKKSKPSYLLSMKDLNTIESIGDLIDIGVDSLKIEGRMKRKEYVYMVTKLYRKAIDNYFLYHDTKITKEDMDSLMLLFNRDFTKGFLFHEDMERITNSFRPNHMGVPLGEVILAKGKSIFIKLCRDLSLKDGIRILTDTEDVGFVVDKMFLQKKSVSLAHKGDTVQIYLDTKVPLYSKVLKTTDARQIERIQRELSGDKKFSIRGEVFIEDSKPILFRVWDEDYMVEVESDVVVEKATNSPTSKERIALQLRKFGGTVYQMDTIEIHLASKDVFIPITVLNELRRMITSKLNERRLYQIPYEKNIYELEVPNYTQERKMGVLIQSQKEYLEVRDKNFDIIYTENPDLCSHIEQNKLIFRLPRVIHNYYEYTLPLLIGEVGSLYRYGNLSLVTDFSLNVVNSYAVAFLHSIGVKRVTLSYEVNKEEIKNIISAYEDRYHMHPNIEVIASSVPEVMVSKLNLPKMFGSVEGENYLKDSFGNQFRVVAKEDGMRIYHFKSIEDNDYNSYYEMGVNTIRIHRSL